MRHLSCRVCGEAVPAAWEDVSFVDGRRVAACPYCGAHYLWQLWHRAGLGWLHHEGAGG